MKHLFAYAVIIVLGVFHAFSQSKPPRYSQVGPKGNDTSMCSKIYVIRENDSLPNILYLRNKDYPYIFAKVFANNYYLLYFPPIGRQTFQSASELSGIVEVELNLTPQSVHYIKQDVTLVKEMIAVSLSVLDSSIGRPLLAARSTKIQNRYSCFPPGGNMFFASDLIAFEYEKKTRMNDSSFLIINKQQYCSFLPPGRLDIEYNSLGRIAYGYSSYPVSSTYSEILISGDKTNCKSKTIDEFENVCTQMLTKELSKNKRFTNTKIEVIRKNDGSIGEMNLLVFIQYEDHNADNKGYNYYLNTRAAVRYFCWKEPNGKLKMSYFSLSERGLSTELSSKNELLERFDDFDKSLQMHIGVLNK